MQIKIVPNDKGNPPGKLADAELHFTDGPLAGLKLIGFAVWERRTGSGPNVTFPARQYSINGERRSFALLRPVLEATAQDRIAQSPRGSFAGPCGSRLINLSKTRFTETDGAWSSTGPAVLIMVA